MDEFSELQHLGALGDEGQRQAARQRLDRAIRSETYTRRRFGFMIRATSIGIVLFTIWSIAPSSPTDDELPLLGLAAATARRGVDVVGPNELWYTKAEVVERIDVSNSRNTVTVMQHSIREQWSAPEAATGVERTTISEYKFLSQEDEVRFSKSDVLSGLPRGTVHVDSLDLAEQLIDPMWSHGPEAIESRLRVMAGDEDDLRLERVGMLKAATQLMYENGTDPARQSLLLYTISDFPGIEVSRGDGAVSVTYRFVLDGTAQQMVLEFDAATGRLSSETVSTLPYGRHSSVLLAHTEYEWGVAARPSSPTVFHPDGVAQQLENRSGRNGQEQP